MDHELQGRSIIITGAASGLGRAWTLAALAAGAHVLAADLNGDGLAQLSRDVEGSPAAHPGQLQTLHVDVSNGGAVEAMVEAAVDQRGRLDVLFNNAGAGFGHLVESAPAGLFEHHVGVHLFGCVNGMRAAIPHMRRAGYGRIINTVSRNAEFDQAGTSAYAAAKAGMWAASRVVARELADVDILVNMLIPGPTNTAIWGRSMPQLQSPDVTWPTARMLATLPAGGPSGRVFWNEREYALFDPANRERVPS